MKILYLGDVMGELGIRAVEAILPGVVREHGVEVVIAQGENVTDGKGVVPADFERLRTAGVHMLTGGNWTLHRPEIHALLNDESAPVIRPANYPQGTPGLGAKYIKTPGGKVLVISLLGQIVGKDSERAVDNPLHVVDAILEREKGTVKAATVVNIHGDFSSEKIVLGYYLDGRVTMVVGDHWHVATADAIVLPKGTAHQTDVGMCGILHGSLGVKLESIIPRWRDNRQTANQLETEGPVQFNAVLVESAEDGLATSARGIHIIREL
jgi:2',3'-cyclic-nucleotide 2'-phosphodiesterase